MERQYRITVNGRSYQVTVEDLTDNQSSPLPIPHLAGTAFAPVAAAPLTTPTATSAGSGDEVAPMAGVVVSVDMVLGQQVSAGEKIVTLEAMKMKTPVVAKRDGRVSAIHVSAGTAVIAGQALLSIE